MKRTIAIATLVAATVAVSGFTYSYWHQKTPTVFFAGHTHVDDKTIDAPQHSGGTDSRGCHNASVPYHCH